MVSTEGNSQSSPQVRRRDFISRILLVWGSLLWMPLFYAVAKFVYPPLEKGNVVASISAGSINDIAPNSSRIVKFNRRPVIVVRTRQDQFKAFAANCTHLGCVIEYRQTDRNFHCNCHGSVFDINGKNVKGPATIPLQSIKVSLKDSQVIISTSTV